MHKKTAGGDTKYPCASVQKYQYQAYIPYNPIVEPSVLAALDAASTEKSASRHIGALPYGPAHASRVLSHDKLAQASHRQISLTKRRTPKPELRSIGSDNAIVVSSLSFTHFVVNPPFRKCPVPKQSSSSHCREDASDVSPDYRRMGPFVLGIFYHAVDHAAIEEQPEREDEFLES